MKDKPALADPRSAALFVEDLNHRFCYAWPPGCRTREAHELGGLVKDHRYRYGQALAYRLRDLAQLLRHRRLQREQEERRRG